MSAAPERTWSSNLTFLAAAVGSAVGISNVWKFTYVAGENGGGAFVLIYVAAIALIALPALIAEFLVGRRGGASVVKSMDNLAAREGTGKGWRYYGVMAAVGAFIALSFYAVIAGWTLDYFYHAIVFGFDGMTAQRSNAALDQLMGDSPRMMVSQVVFLGLTGATVALGVRRGLENVLRWLTPALFVILIALLIYAMVAGDFAAGAAFLFVPDFSKLNMETALLAIGQAFFSLGIGLGVLLTIGAYMDRQSSIVRASLIVAVADGAVALTAGLAIFPVVFAHGLSPAEGPGPERPIRVAATKAPGEAPVRAELPPEEASTEPTSLEVARRRVIRLPLRPSWARHAARAIGVRCAMRGQR